jgi:hypothetical protein
MQVVPYQHSMRVLLNLAGWRWFNPEEVIRIHFEAPVSAQPVLHSPAFLDGGGTRRAAALAEAEEADSENRNLG